MQPTHFCSYCHFYGTGETLGTLAEVQEHVSSHPVTGEALSIADRLEELRTEIDAERISSGELAELQNWAPYIDRSDMQLLEWAGVPEHEEEVSKTYGACGVEGCTDCLPLFDADNNQLTEGN